MSEMCESWGKYFLILDDDEYARQAYERVLHVARSECDRVVCVPNMDTEHWLEDIRMHMVQRRVDMVFTDSFACVSPHMTHQCLGLPSRIRRGLAPEILAQIRSELQLVIGEVVMISSYVGMENPVYSWSAVWQGEYVPAFRQLGIAASYMEKNTNDMLQRMYPSLSTSR